MPTLAVEGAFSQRMLEGGAGTSGPDLPLPGTSGGSGSSLPTAPDRQWSLSLTASFPLFQGTERAARQRRAADQLEASRTEQMIAKLGVEQRIRSALTQLETAHASVQRAQMAARAAQRTLEVTQAAYRQGTASVLDLIDAQRTAVTARQEASNTAYNLLSAWIDVQRSGGSFRVLRTGSEQAAFAQRLQSFLSDPTSRGS
jgi:outer membrane protein TolC